jgi:hypothetical protein
MSETHYINPKFPKKTYVLIKTEWGKNYDYAIEERHNGSRVTSMSLNTKALDTFMSTLLQNGWTIKPVEKAKQVV